jgi:hypothetical protein
VVVVLVGVLALILWSTYIGTGIQTSPQETQLVYDVWVHSGQRYNNVLYPQSEDTLYMISEIDNVITPKLTEVYYWSLTSEYKADWSALDENLIGVIEVKRGNETIELLERTPYSLVYSNITPKEIVFGEQAVESYQQYQAESRRLAGEIDTYYEAIIEYQLEYEKYIDEIKNGNIDAVRPEPPIDDTPILEQYVSKPAPGYHLNLPIGEYTIQLLTDEGKVVEGSHKKLHVFSPRQEAVGYKAFITERWTKPETGASPEDTFYVQPEKTLFLQPYHTQEYNRFDYTKLIAPQQRAVGENAWFWVLTDEVYDVELHVMMQGQPIETLIMDQFDVEQIPGSKLGYDIVPFVEDQTAEREPAFSAFQITPPKEEDIVQIQMVDSDGQVLEGSDREIRIITRTSVSIMYFIAPIPIIFGAVAFGWRRYRAFKQDQA